MAYDASAMTLVIGNNLDPRVEDKLRAQVAADILTSEQLEEREKHELEKQKLEEEAQAQNDELGVGDGAADGFTAPDQGEVSQIENDSLEEKKQIAEDNQDDANPDDGSSDPADDDGEEPDVKDELDEPNAAFEHAQSAGPIELGYYFKHGIKAYRKRVRKNVLATETLQLDIARKQSLIKRLLYVKPADTGFTSKLQTMIANIQNPGDWLAIVDPEGTGSAQQEFEKRQITKALEDAGIQVFDNVETLADAMNDIQKAIREPSAL